MTQNVTEKLALLPDSPGCYLMKENGTIIYVGKAINLKHRVRSYFQGREHTAKVSALVSHIDDFDIMLCQTNLEALMLECNLIKLHKPRYNILLKDDKHYPFIRIDLRDPYPHAEVARRAQQDGARYFGPYTGATAAREALEILSKIAPLRKCALKLPLKAPRRPCVNHEVGQCAAPCANLCTQEEYAAIVRRVVALLSGRHTEVVDALKTEMDSCAARFEYERAAYLRDAIRAVEGIWEKQTAQRASAGDRDVIALCSDGVDALAQVLYIRQGRMVGGDAFPLPGEGGEVLSEVAAEFILRFYDERTPAREVFTPHTLPDPEAMLEFLKQKRSGAVDLRVPARGDGRAQVLMAEKNARDALQKRGARAQEKYRRTLGACAALGEAIGMKTPPRRIEGFDISNTQGVLSVSSMVVFIDGEPAPREYRHFRIQTVQGANDFASMRETLLRRLTHAAQCDPGWEAPDLILIDGGPEQLAFAQSAMHELGLNIPMFGLAKRLEEIFLPGRTDSILLDRHSPALHLIQRVRDEAHRFAITHHRALRGKAAVHSQLENIPGVGPARRRALLTRFGSLQAIRDASLEELAQTPGVSKPAAEAVFTWARKSQES